MRKLLAVIVLALALAGCGRSENVEVIDGVTCVVARDGLGHVDALDCQDQAITPSPTQEGNP